MAKKKYYSVKKGKTPGVYNTWDECKSQVDGFSGAEYKSFGTLKEAQDYLNDNKETKELKGNDINIVDNDELIAYVDGSYNDETKEFSYGMVLIHNGKEEYDSKKVSDTDLAEMRNVAGEIKGSEAAMRYAVENNYKKLVIYHDYEGISKWCTGEWRAKKDGTKAYQDYFNSIKDFVAIRFVKVLGHSNDKYNDMADELAKNAIFGINIQTKNEGCEIKEVKENVYISRDLDELNIMLVNEGNIIWENFVGKGIQSVGQQQRFSFSVDGKEAKLDIYQRSDGSTTFRPTGVNMEYSQQLKVAIEKCGLKNTSENKTHTIYLGKEWVDKTIEYLGQLPEVETSENILYDRHIYHYLSKNGDKLTLSIFNDFKIMVQGKPLYLYNEFLSYVSLLPNVSDNDVVEMTNVFVETTADVNDVRVKMSKLLPKAYNSDRINKNIWKLFSPSIVLIEDKKEFEDYTCCIFPALRALEGYLLLLLDEKGIIIDKKHNFSTVFELQIPGNDTSKRILLKKHKKVINEPIYEQVLEKVYNYFITHRHVYFHANQIATDIRMIETKQEAKDMIYEIANLIETTYVKVEKLF